MKNSSYVIGAGLSLLAVTSAPSAQQQAVRQLAPATTATTEKLGAVSAVRHLSDGRVLVNDIIGRRVLLFDSTLRSFTVVADTTSATGNAYGARPGGLIAFHGDSTLFVDPASLSMLVIDGNGKIARVMSAPRASDAGFLVGGPFGTPGFDPQGRIIYRAPPRIAFGGLRRGPGAASGGTREALTPPVIPDSAPLVRVDLATRKVDTLAFFRTPQVRMNVNHDADGGIRVMPTVNPLPVIDDWGILPDGTVALVRGKDYHIDWITPEKTMTSSAKIPFQWERLSDDAKVAYIDSTRKAFEAARARGDLSGMFGGAFGGAPMMRMQTQGAPGQAAGAAPGGATTTTTVTAGTNTTVTAGPGGPLGGRLPNLTFVEPSELPDYKPPFSGNATRVDTEGNLWIRTTRNLNGLPVYDVINRKGELVDQVQLPVGRVITGFGAGGVVYLGFRDGDVARLEKARIR
ncbi:MAG TPA: hypothetical protein VFS56_06720 [Gemmatimonadaceae bacterium]|nr:hypothetical protein [Gemmatimonadaceae bacterium]